MAEEFQPITSQEQLDSVIKDRINRLNEKHAKEISEKYSDYDTMKDKITNYEKQIGDLTAAMDGLNQKVSAHDAEIAERDAKIKDFELGAIKTRVAHDLGLSYDAIDFLRGDDEASILSSAESLKSLVGTKTAPSYNAEPVNQNSENAAYKGMLANLF